MKNGVILCTSVEQGEKTTSVNFSLPITTLPDELPEINFDGIEMEVSCDFVEWNKVVVIAKINGRYFCSRGGYWKYARQIQQNVKVTKEQIAEAFNTTVELLEIE